MGVAVFDADVLIGFRNASDPRHADAVECVRRSLAPGTRRMLSAVNYSEILIGPMRAGKAAERRVDAMLEHLGIEIISADAALAQHAAAVRARTGLKLSDAYALATAMLAEFRQLADVRLESFDAKVLRAHADLHPN